MRLNIVVKIGKWGLGRDGNMPKVKWGWGEERTYRHGVGDGKVLFKSRGLGGDGDDENGDSCNGDTNLSQCSSLFQTIIQLQCRICRYIFVCVCVCVCVLCSSKNALGGLSLGGLCRLVLCILASDAYFVDDQQQAVRSTVISISCIYDP